MLLWAGEPFPAIMLESDQSVGGVAVLVKDGTVVKLDQEVRLSDGDRSEPAVVKHVYQRKDGKYHVGLAWGGLVRSSQHGYCRS